MCTINPTNNEIYFLRWYFQNFIVTSSVGLVYGKYLHELILGLARSSSAKFIVVKSSGSAIS